MSYREEEKAEIDEVMEEWVISVAQTVTVTTVTVGVQLWFAHHPNMHKVLVHEMSMVPQW